MCLCVYVFMCLLPHLYKSLLVLFLLYSHLFNNFSRTVSSAWETGKVREDSGYVGQERAAGHHHEDRGAAEEQPAGDTIIICNTGATTHYTCDVRHGKIWSSLRLRLMNSWSLFWRILKTRQVLHIGSDLWTLNINHAYLLQDPTLHPARNMFATNPLNLEDVPESPKVSVIKSHSTAIGQL